MILSRLLNQSSCDSNGKNYSWHFYFEESYITQDTDEHYLVNLAEELLNYARTIISRIDTVLLNLSMRYPIVGRTFTMPAKSSLTHRILLCDTESAANEGIEILRYLSELDYIKSDTSFLVFHISLQGWKRIEQLKRQLNEIKQGFIAMSYKPECNPILETFRAAIHESGYIAQVIGEKEHNHQIVPEMFFEIERSKFMVVDVTHQNYGAYYEAGYAQALGKEVIVCCSKEVFDNPETRPHFDIAQKAMIVWTDHADLKDKLKRRIEATVR